jgi:hypothetical protein
MKWKYDKANKNWYCHAPDELCAWESINIYKEDNWDNKNYKLVRDYFVVVGRFKKLTSAKKVAELLIKG